MNIPVKYAGALQEFSQLRHGFFTRQGGVSSGFCDSLNVTFKDLDHPENVEENRRIIGKTLRSTTPPTFIQQVHGVAVHTILSADDLHKRVNADAIISTVPNTLIAVQTADCIPILLVDPYKHIVAAIHAGWRGAAKGVVEATLTALNGLGAQPQHLVAAIGPALAQENFEVGPDLFSAFCDKDTHRSVFFNPGTQSQRWQFDLKGYVARVLATHGVSQIEILPHDTYADAEHFFSYRRATHRGEPGCGGQASCIGWFES